MNWWWLISLWGGNSVVTLHTSLLHRLSSTAPMTAFRKKDKHEKEDAAQDRVPQGQYWVLFLFFFFKFKKKKSLYVWNSSSMTGFVFMLLDCCCVVCQMTQCQDRTLKPRQQRTSWTSTGTSRGPARVMEPPEEPLMMDQEVSRENRHMCSRHMMPLDTVIDFNGVYFQSCVWRTMWMTLPEKMLCKTFLQMICQTQPARRHSSTIPNSLSGETFKMVL